MIFKKIIIEEGLFSKKIEFSRKSNLIFSDANSVGKTTLIRIMLYSLGFAIPSTKGIDFSKCKIKTYLQCKNEDIEIFRHGSYAEIHFQDRVNTFFLPQDASNMHKIIFKTDNTHLLNNILGIFYFDQEKGWTLLNRGKVVGNIGFSIEKIIAALTNDEAVKIYDKIERNKKYLDKYLKIKNIADFQRDLNTQSNNIVFDEYDEEITNKIEVLRFELTSLKKEMDRINKVINANNLFKNYIEKMKISVSSPTGEVIPVTSKNIIGFNENFEFLNAKRKIISSQISSLNSEVKQLSKKNQILYDEDEIFKTLHRVESKLTSFDIDYMLLESTIKALKDAESSLKEKIKVKIKTNNPVADDIYKSIIKYASELELTPYIDFRENFIFTNDLKSLSGAILHKMVFIFKLAYIKVAEKKLCIKFPILLDSPNGREVTKENIEKMISILTRDFPNNQIIISSIFKYSIPNLKVHKIANKLITN